MQYTQITLTASATKNYQKAEVSLNVILDNPNDTIEAAQSYVNSLALHQLEDLNAKVQPMVAPVSKAPAYTPREDYRTGYASATPRASREEKPMTEGQRNTLINKFHCSPAEVNAIRSNAEADRKMKEIINKPKAEPNYREAPRASYYPAPTYPGYSEDEDYRGN